MFKNKKWNKNRKKERKKYLICELLFIGTVIDVFFYDVTVAGNGQVNKLFHRCGYFGWPFIIFYLSFEGGGYEYIFDRTKLHFLWFHLFLAVVAVVVAVVGKEGGGRVGGWGEGGRGSWVISLAVIGSAGFSGSICSESCSTWNWCFGHFWGSLMASSEWRRGRLPLGFNWIGVDGTGLNYIHLRLNWHVDPLTWIFSDWLGLAWIGLAWLGLAWLGLDWRQWDWLELNAP